MRGQTEDEFSIDDSIATLVRDSKLIAGVVLAFLGGAYLLPSLSSAHQERALAGTALFGLVAVLILVTSR